MVAAPPPKSPQRREGRRFTIPTPADLRPPRQNPALADPGSSERPDDPVAGQSGGLPASSGILDEDLPGATRPSDMVAADHPEGAAPPVPVAAAEGPGGAPSADEPPHPTPATLPRPSRTAQGSASPPPEPPRRIFPNPATLMAAGRGARKARTGGLRARRLPKVEETSAGGVVLDLGAKPPAVALIARHDRRSRLLWSLPKGHVEPGETPEQAALREVREETGLVGRIVAPLGIIDFWFVVEDRRIHKTVHHFVIEAVGGELSDADVEVEAVAWVPFDQVVRKLAYGDERRLVEKVAQIVPGVR